MKTLLDLLNYQKHPENRLKTNDFVIKTCNYLKSP